MDFDPTTAQLVDDFDPTTAQPVTRTAGEEAKRQAGLMGRMAADTVAALPLAALEGGAGVGNLINRAMGGEGRVSFRQMYEEAINRLLPKPETPLEQATNVVGQMVLGSKLVPPTPSTVPGNYVRTPTQSQQVLAKAQQQGYVVPPATSNPTAVTRTLEGVAGKLTTAQAASAKNQTVTTRLAKRALGLPDDAPLTTDLIRGVRQQAAQGYEAVRGAGAIKADTEFGKDLASITAKYRGAAKDYPELAKSDVADIVAAIDKPQVDADSAVDAIAILRERADDAFGAGRGTLGKAYKDASKAIENLIERNLVAAGKNGADLLKQFRQARQTIAKTYSVEKAFNASTGQVSGTKLGQQVAKGKPLSGELRTAGEFAQAFPKAAREFNESLPGISPLDFYAAGGVSALSQKPWYLLYPFVRQGTRNALLSPLGQRLAVPSEGGPLRPELVNALGLGAALVGQ